jgi:TrmH family RNA methyltransferase
MSEYAVVVVEPETPGNVGTIARAMKNFGVSDLKLVDPPEIPEGSEAYGFAGHAREDVLPNADAVTFEEVVESYHTVGFTAITAEDATSHTRFPYTTPEELSASLATVEADTALVFGREGRGLNNEELEQLDQVASIPANPEYPVMNLGQAANVVLYELRDLFLTDDHLPDRTQHRAEEHEIERLHEQFDRFLDAVEHRDHKRKRSSRLLRRILGRTHPTNREVTTLMGLFRKTADRFGDDVDSLDDGDDEDGGIGEDGADDGDGGSGVSGGRGEGNH